MSAAGIRRQIADESALAAAADAPQLSRPPFGGRQLDAAAYLATGLWTERIINEHAFFGDLADLVDAAHPVRILPAAARRMIMAINLFIFGPLHA